MIRYNAVDFFFNDGGLSVGSDEGQANACGTDVCRRKTERTFPAGVGIARSGADGRSRRDRRPVVKHLCGALQQFVTDGKTCGIVLLCGMDGEFERRVGLSVPRLFGIGGYDRITLFHKERGRLARKRISVAVAERKTYPSLSGIILQ